MKPSSIVEPLTSDRSFLETPRLSLSTGAPPTDPATSSGRFPAGLVLAGRYRIITLAGRGGMGEVYRADDLMLGQPVALKFLPSPGASQGRRRALLFSELRMARHVVHPHVCRVYDIAETDGLCFLSMEYIVGEDLATLLRRIGRLPREKALELGFQTAAGLAAIHRQGILHRDLKPANLMLDDSGAVRITDFGLARPTSEAATCGLRAGTPAYRAPEVEAGAPPSEASDLFSFGLLLFELLTGTRPAELRDPPGEEAERLLPRIAPRARRAILACLCAEPAGRPASAAELVEILRPRSGSEVAQGGAGFDRWESWRPDKGAPVPHRPHWLLVEELGRGGFGEAWRVEHHKTGERRVLKFCFEPDLLTYLEREVTVFRLLRQELGYRADIVRIFDWSFDSPPIYLEMEDVAGGSLVQWSEARGGLDNIPLSVRLELVAQVAEALGAAHSVGVLHQDVKPENVLICDGVEGRPQAQLSDFGLGRIALQRLARAGITALGFGGEPREGGLAEDGGTRLYQAPEQLEGKAANQQADVFALGVMLYQMAVGDLTRALAPGWQRQMDDQLLREDIEATVDGAPERRLSADDLARRLRSLPRRRAERLEVLKRREEQERSRVADEKAKKRRRMAGVAALALMVFVAAVGFQALRIAQESERAEYEAARARDIARAAVAGEWLARDPTRAALVLLEVEGLVEPSLSLGKLRAVLDQELALFELPGNGSSVNAAQWSPDGRWIATASSDGFARIWPADGLGAPRVFDHRGDWVVSARWSPDSRYLATTSGRGAVWIWPVDGGDGLRLEGHGDWSYNAFWSPDSRFVVTSSVDGTARLWSLTSRAAVRIFELSGDAVHSMDWSPDGTRLVAAGADSTAGIWRLDSDQDPVILRGHEGMIYYAAFDPTGERVLTSSEDGTARVWPADGRGAARVFRGHEGGVRLALWSPDGESIVTASADGTARVWRADGEGEPVVLQGHDGPVIFASWSPDGQRILTNSRDRTARVWRADGKGEPLVLRGHSALVSDAMWSPDGRFVVTSSYDGTTRVWRGERPVANAWASPEGPPREVAWSPDGSRLMVATDRGALVMLDADGGGQLAIARAHELAIREAVWSPDGRSVLTASVDHTAKISTAGPGGGSEVVLADHLGTVFDAAWSPDGERVVTVDQGGNLRFWHRDGSPLGPARKAHDGPATAVAWSPDGELVATVGLDDAVRLWTPEAEELASEHLGHRGWLLDVAWSPDGRWVATAAQDHLIRLFPVVAQGLGKPMTLAGHTARVMDLEFSPDGRHLVSGSEDHTARIWALDPAGWVSGMTLEGHRSAVVDVAWSPDGERVTTASLDGTVRLWPLDPGALRQRIRAATSVCLTPGFRVENLAETTEHAAARYRACESSRGRGTPAASSPRTVSRSPVSRSPRG